MKIVMPEYFKDYAMRLSDDECRMNEALELKELFPELQEWGTEEIAGAWANYCTQVFFANWLGVWRDVFFLGYILLRQQGNEEEYIHSMQCQEAYDAHLGNG